MRIPAILAFVSVMAVPASGQWTVDQFRFDFGYGVAPRISNFYDQEFVGPQLFVSPNPRETFLGLQGVLTARLGEHEFGFHYTKRDMKQENTFIQASSTTLTVQYGRSWKTTRATFAISAGIGSCFLTTRILQPYYNYLFPLTTTVVSEESKETRIAIAGDVRMSLNISRYLGLGGALFGAYVKDNSYLGFNVFVRIST